MPQFCLKHVGKDYRTEPDKRVLHAVREIDLTIERGEFVFITGSSGAGKTTLLQMLSCNLQPTCGSVYFDGVNVTALSPRRQDHIRLTFGYVPQLSSLIRKRTVGENLLPVAALGPGRNAQAPARIRKALGLVGLSDVMDCYPAELSMGQCRRVELARAILNNPQVLFLDELTANLDEDTAWDMFLFLDELNRLGTTVIMASHAKRFINLMRRRVITLVDGRILGDVQRGRYGDLI